MAARLHTEAWYLKCTFPIVKRATQQQLFHVKHIPA